MTLEFGKTPDWRNTNFAPLAVLMVCYNTKNMFDPLKSVKIVGKKNDFATEDKLYQIMLSILANCTYISEINTKLRPDEILAQVNRIDRFADQSTLATALNELSQMNIQQLRGAVRTISNSVSRTKQHDWRGFLMCDFDLSGLPCSKNAEGSSKGYYPHKKTQLEGNWPV